MKVEFNGRVFDELIDRNPEKALAAADKFPKFDQWRSRKENPTINQLAQLSHYFNIPFGYFFLTGVPANEYTVPHYRSSNHASGRPSEELQDTIQTLRERQLWASDILKDLRGEPLAFGGTIGRQIHVEEAGAMMRRVLNLPEDWARHTPTWDGALKLLVDKTEQAGIFVVINGVVNNNTHRKLDLDEFRGFVLYDQYAPFVFINNNDTTSGKIFTIAHEIAHVLTGNSASFDLRMLMPATDPIEELCNAIAAEFLVPKRLLLRETAIAGNNFQILARYFKVSTLVIARRLLDLGRISKENFFDFYNRSTKIERKQNAGNGGNFYNTAPYRIGRSFFNLVYSTVRRNKMLYRDAFKLTGLKSKTFDEYVKKHI